MPCGVLPGSLDGVNPIATQSFTLAVGAAVAQVPAQAVPALGPVALAILVALLALAGVFAGRGGWLR